MAEPFDLARLPKRKPECGSVTNETDIVVCAPKAMDLVGIDASAFAEAPPKIGVDLPGGGAVTPRVVQRSLSGGDTRPAVMVGLKLPF